MNWHIREAVRHIAAGGIIAYPTETVYGLGCDPFNGDAVLRLLDLKHRDIDQGVILIASDFTQLEPLLLPLPPAARKRVTTRQQRPVTWTLPCLPEIPVWLRGRHASLAVRITDHPLAAALCEHWDGPLVSTSANVHGRSPAISALDIYNIFNNKLDYVLHGTCGTKQASTIRDGLSGKVLRQPE
jgi:L-threonylcarbamoyladenylate synthase